MSESLYSEVGKNDRYFSAILLAFVLGLLLLFQEHLDPSVKKTIIPYLTIYIAGNAIIAQIQNMLGNRQKLRIESINLNRNTGAPLEHYVGLETWKFTVLMSTHVAWFAGFVVMVLLKI